MNTLIDTNQYYLVRSPGAGVFAGYITEFDPVAGVAVMRDVRRIWYWEGANTMSQLALDGTKKPKECKFPGVIPTQFVLGIVEVIPCSAKAEKSIKAVPVWSV